jgi:hypothetical protein
MSKYIILCQKSESIVNIEGPYSLVLQTTLFVLLFNVFGIEIYSLHYS